MLSACRINEIKNMLEEKTPDDVISEEATGSAIRKRC
jgi:hypothetical protein